MAGAASARTLYWAERGVFEITCAATSKGIYGSIYCRRGWPPPRDPSWCGRTSGDPRVNGTHESAPDGFSHGIRRVGHACTAVACVGGRYCPHVRLLNAPWRNKLRTVQDSLESSRPLRRSDAEARLPQ